MLLTKFFIGPLISILVWMRRSDGLVCGESVVLYPDTHHLAGYTFEGKRKARMTVVRRCKGTDGAEPDRDVEGAGILHSLEKSSRACCPNALNSLRESRFMMRREVDFSSSHNYCDLLSSDIFDYSFPTFLRPSLCSQILLKSSTTASAWRLHSMCRQ